MDPTNNNNSVVPSGGGGFPPQNPLSPGAIVSGPDEPTASTSIAPTASVTFTPTKGDIVLSDQKQGGGRGRRAVIIGVVVAAVVLTVGIIVTLFVTGVWGGRSNSAVAENTTAMAQYTNYVTNGNKNEKLEGEYTRTRAYYVSEMFMDEDENAWKSFYDEATGLLEKINASGDENLVNSINDQKTLLELFNVAHDLKKYDAAELARIGIEEDFTSARNSIGSKVATLSGENNDYANEYVTKMGKYLDAMENVLGIFSTFGCEADMAEEVASCEMPNEETMASYMEAADVAYGILNEIDYTLNSAMAYYIRSVYTLANYGEAENG